MVNNEIFLGSGASTTLIPEHDIYMSLDGTGGSASGAIVIPDTAFTNEYRFVPNIYVGCILDLYTSTDVLISSHTIKSNSKTGFVLNSDKESGTASYAYLRAYGAPAPHPLVSTREALLADNWLGILESITFPNLSQELKQLNLGLGGTRNFSYQYKGIRTADNGSMALVANTGIWLYYALGACDSISYTYDNTSPITLTVSGQEPVETSADDGIFIEGATTSGQTGSAVVTSTGPHFYRTEKGGRTVVPPVDFEIFDTGGFQQLNIASDGRPDNITYVFKELNTDQLPSFSLEQSISKDPATLTTDATSTADESTSFTRIARGCRIDSLTLEASEGEELKMNMDINARLVDSITDIYRDTNTTQVCSQGGAGTSLTVADSSVLSIGMVVTGHANLAASTTISSITDATTVVLSATTTSTGVPSSTTLTFTNNPNYIARAGQTSNDALFNWSAGTEHGAPFFFSQGSFEAFGQQFLKVNSVSIAIQNNLMDKRYMGGHRDMKEGIPAQRSYEITFEAVVTDDKLFTEMLNETEVEASSSRVRFVFEKPDTSEKITLNFEDYFLDTTEITIPDDKGPVSFSSTIKPRNLSTVNTAGNSAVGCEVITDFVLMG